MTIFPTISRALNPVSIAVAVTLGSLSLVACGGSSNNDDSPTNNTTNLTSVSFLLKDSLTGAALSNVASYITIQNAPISNDAGYVYIDKLEKTNDKEIYFVKKGYAKQHMVVPIATHPGLNNLMVQLLKLNPATDSNQRNTIVKGDAAITYTAANAGSQVTLDYTNLKANSNDTEPSQPVSVYLSDISQTDRDAIANDAMVFNDDAATPLAIYAATHLQLNQAYAAGDTAADNDLYDQLSLVSLKKATSIDILATGAALPPSVSLYYYDEKDKRWTTDSKLNLITKDGKQYYSGMTTHTGYLLAANPATNVQTITGTIKDSQGMPVAHVQVVANGAYGTATAFSDDKGTYTLKLAQVDNNSQVTLNAYKGTATAIGNDATPNMTLAETTNSVTAKANVMWADNKHNLDLNVMLPNGEVVYLNRLTSSDGSVTLTQNLQDSLQESLDFNKLLVGTYRIFVYNFNKNPITGISNIGTKVSLSTNGTTQDILPQASYSDIDKEILTAESPLSDNRSVAWYAADMVVSSNCTVSINEPSSTMYRRWLNATQFATNGGSFNPNAKPYMQIRLDNLAPTYDATGSYCSTK